MIGTTEGVKGEFRWATLNAPVVVQEGDFANIVGNQVIIVRNNVVVATREILGPSEVVPLGALQQESIDRVMYFWRRPVPGIIQTLNDVQKNTANGEIEFSFGTESRTFASGAAALAEVEYIDTNPELAQDMLILKTLRQSPDETNLTTCVGKKCAIDMTANTPFTID